jgi:hypothetical protein
MSTEANMTVMASALVDSKLLSAIQNPLAQDLNPDVRAGAEGLDSQKLALFAGFITMVRHNNDLFQHLPNTLRVLRHYGVELSVFRDHFLATGRPAKLLADKIERALTTLRHFADSRRATRFVGLRDVLTHEECHWRISQDLANYHYPVPPARVGVSARAIPQKLAPTYVARIMRAPEKLVAALNERQPLRSAAYRPHYRLYVGDVRACAVRTIRVTRCACQVLGLVDRRRACAEILALVVREGQRLETARATLLALSDADVISFHNGTT